jgi:hypothetical protein
MKTPWRRDERIKKRLIISRLSGDVSGRWSVLYFLSVLPTIVRCFLCLGDMQLGIFVLKEKKFMSDPDSRLQTWVADLDSVYGSGS